MSKMHYITGFAQFFVYLKKMEVYASVDYYFKGFLLRKATGVNPITLTTPDADFFCILWFTGVNRPPVVVGLHRHEILTSIRAFSGMINS